MICSRKTATSGAGFEIRLQPHSVSMNASNIPEVCPELGLEVSVSQIDKELRKLWEQDEARTNASLMNLVVYSEVMGMTRSFAPVCSQTICHGTMFA